MLAHVPIVLALQLAGWGLFLLGVPPLWCFGVLAVLAGVYREITQHEYRVIEAKYGNRRANMPVLEGLRFWDWNAHSIKETLATIPAVALPPALIALLGGVL